MTPAKIVKRQAAENAATFSGPGGTEPDMVESFRETLRAELCELANNYSYQWGTKIIDALLKDYVVTPRHGFRKALP